MDSRDASLLGMKVSVGMGCSVLYRGRDGDIDRTLYASQRVSRCDLSLKRKRSIGYCDWKMGK